MTTTVNADSLQIFYSGLSDVVAEAILQQAIGEINLGGYTLDLLTGSSGSMTGDYATADAAGIVKVACAIYAINYRNSGSNSQQFGVGSINKSSSGSSGMQSVSDVAIEVARQLLALMPTSTDLPIFIANEPLE